MSLKATRRTVDGIAIIDLSRRIVLGEGSDTLRSVVNDLVEHGSKNILLNLADVSYVDSSGLGSRVSGFTTVSARQGRMKLLNLTKRVHDRLQITKLLTVFETFDDESSAVQSFR